MPDMMSLDYGRYGACRVCGHKCSHRWTSGSMWVEFEGGDTATVLSCRECPDERCVSPVTATHEAVVFNGPWPDHDRCRALMFHRDRKAKFRCVLRLNHEVTDEDSDHIDEHGCYAPVLVSQATIREVRHWQDIPFPEWD